MRLHNFEARTCTCVKDVLWWGKTKIYFGGGEDKLWKSFSKKRRIKNCTKYYKILCNFKTHTKMSLKSVLWWSIKSTFGEGVHFTSLHFENVKKWGRRRRSEKICYWVTQFLIFEIFENHFKHERKWSEVLLPTPGELPWTYVTSKQELRISLICSIRKKNQILTTRTKTPQRYFVCEKLFHKYVQIFCQHVSQIWKCLIRKN